MSILIKGMEIPTSCCECFAFKSNASGQLFCKAKRIAFGKEDAEWLPLKTPNWCPLTPVPPHGRLIDADKIGLTDFEIILCQKGNPFKNALEMLLEKIENAPTIIPADKEGEMTHYYEEPLKFYPYPTACGYRCWDGKEWRDCNKHGRPYERK